MDHFEHMKLCKRLQNYYLIAGTVFFLSLAGLYEAYDSDFRSVLVFVLIGSAGAWYKFYNEYLDVSGETEERLRKNKEMEDRVEKWKKEESE